MSDQKKNQLAANQSALASAAARRAALQKAAAGVSAKPSRSEMLAKAAAIPKQRPRLVFAFDATGSRAGAWDAARRVTDTLFMALPGQLDVALAVHGGSEVHTFTDFTADANELRDVAATIKCMAGGTQLIPIMERTRNTADVKTLLYIGDAFEESLEQAMGVAEGLKAKGIRLIVLHDGNYEPVREAFTTLTGRTGGFVLPFDAAAADKLRDVFEAIAVLAVGGVQLLETRKKTLTAAPLLLSHLSGKG